MDGETIFDKILAGDIGADVVYEDRYTLAFKDINPVAPVHVLVVPKKKIATLDELSLLDTEYAHHFFQSLPKIAKLCNLAKGYRVVINTGDEGQQTVQYIHAHIIGGRQLKWPPG